MKLITNESTIKTCFIPTLIVSASGEETKLIIIIDRRCYQDLLVVGWLVSSLNRVTKEWCFLLNI